MGYWVVLPGKSQLVSSPDSGSTLNWNGPKYFSGVSPQCSFLQFFRSQFLGWDTLSLESLPNNVLDLDTLFLESFRNQFQGWDTLFLESLCSQFLG